MRIVLIKNKYLFESDKPEGVHPYAVYYDRKTKEMRAVALTHLYLEDEERFAQVKRGNIIKMKLPSFELPSGIKNYYYTATVSGGKIDLKDRKNVIRVNKNHLPKKLSDTIKKFAKKDYNKPQGKKKNSRR